MTPSWPLGFKAINGAAVEIRSGQVALLCPAIDDPLDWRAVTDVGAYNTLSVFGYTYVVFRLIK